MLFSCMHYCISAGRLLGRAVVTKGHSNEGLQCNGGCKSRLMPYYHSMTAVSRQSLIGGHTILVCMMRGEMEDKCMQDKCMQD